MKSFEFFARVVDRARDCLALRALIDRADIVHVCGKLLELLRCHECVSVFSAAKRVHEFVTVLAEHLPLSLGFVLVYDLDLDRVASALIRHLGRDSLCQVLRLIHIELTNQLLNRLLAKFLSVEWSKYLVLAWLSVQLI